MLTEQTNQNFIETSLNLNDHQHQNTNSINNEIVVFIIYFLLTYLSDESDCINTNNNFDQITNFKNSIRNWALEYNVPQNALNGLLIILKKHNCFINLPKDSRTLMYNKKSGY